MNINDKLYQSCINGVDTQSYKSRDMTNIDGTDIYIRDLIIFNSIL